VVVVGGGAEDVVGGGADEVVGVTGAEDVVGVTAAEVVVSGAALVVVAAAAVAVLVVVFLCGFLCFFLFGFFFLCAVVVVTFAADVEVELELPELPQPASTTAAARVVSSARFMVGLPLSLGNFGPRVQEVPVLGVRSLAPDRPTGGRRGVELSGIGAARGSDTPPAGSYTMTAP
jgi:hypothetical protein